MKRHIFAAAFGALLVVLPVRDALRADATLYTVQDLGATPDGLVPTVTGMNASGQVSGYVTSPETGFPQAVRYTSGLGWEYLPGVSTLYSDARGINDSGDVVGTHFNPAAGFRAYRLVGGLVTEVAPLVGGSMTIGFAISQSGEVVGQSNAAGGVFGFRASGSTAVQLPTLLGGSNGTACGVNAAGQIAASSASAAGPEQPYRIEANNSVTPINPFDGTLGTGQACAIDAAGRVGGRATLASAFRAFTVVPPAGPVNVDTFAGSSQSKVESVSGDVAVGWFVLAANGSFHAFVNTPDGSADLNTLITPGTWNLEQAFAVNASGQIAGNGTLSGAPRAFLLTPVDGGEEEDETAPVIHSVTANPSSIAPPNGAMVAVNVSVDVTDLVDPSPVCTVTGIDGHGAPSGDFSVTGALSGSVKATGGATYTFAVSCSDASGNSATGSVDVVVPPDTTGPVVDSVSANPSEIWPPNGALVPVTVTVVAHDDSGATPVCSLTSISASGGTVDDYAITGLLTAKVRAVGGRTYTLNVGCSDAAGNMTPAATAVFVVPDTTAPVIHSVSASPNAVWPPNGKMVAVTVSVDASDNLDAAPYCFVKAVTSNGGDADDALVYGQFDASVRAEKNADGSTRVYTIKVTCQDAAGNKSWSSTTVVVAKDAPEMKGHAR